MSGLPPFSHSPHLVALVAQAERLAALVSRVLPPEQSPRDVSAVKAGEKAPGQDDEVARVAEELLAEAAVASLRLDGSPIDHVPDLEAALEDTTDPPARPTAFPTDPPARPTAFPTDPPARPTAFPAWTPERPCERPSASWLEIFRRGRVADEEVLAFEYLGMRAGLAATDLAQELHVAPQRALAELHRRLTHQLVDPAHAGRIRLSRQAVHDSRVGRIVFLPADPERIPSQMALLARWLKSTATREHGLIVSGVVHHELLAAHPYEAANGRLARTAARLLLRSHGLDPGGLAAAEVALLSDPIGYYGEVAATARRRDLTIWLERWGEAVTGGLRLAARRLGLLEDEVPEPAETFLASWEKPRFTLADYRAEVTVGPEEVRADLERLLDAGRIERVLGSRGLRFAIVGYKPPD